MFLPSHPELSPHAASPVEWWYVQGRLVLADGTARAIMLAVFRGPIGGETPAMAFIAIHDGSGAKAFRRSVISPGMIALIEATTDRVGAAETPAFVLRILKHAFRRDARARVSAGLCVAGNDAVLRTSPFELTWLDIVLREDDDAVRLTFDAEGQTYDLTLRPCAGWSDLAPGNIPSNLGIAGYRSCPRMAVTGRAGDIDLTGSVWFDRQWGDESQIASVRHNRIVLTGWDWFAINLENGLDLMLYRPRDPRSGAVLPGFGAVWSGGQWRPLGAGFDAQPIAWFESPVTGHRYPTCWTLDIPDAGLSLRLEAETAQGEIPIYGPMGWNWQSPARVEGQLDRAPVRGSGWLELNGYGYPLTLRTQMRFWTAYLRALVTQR